MSSRVFMARRANPTDRRRRPSRIRRSALLLLAGLAQRGAAAHAGDDAEFLIGADLAVQRADGMIEISAAGRAHLMRKEYACQDTIDPFLAQHLDVARGDIETANGRASVAVDAAESPLAWLARRKSREGRALIEPVQFQA